ncbi:DUF1559 domain-containing protein [Gimesia sp.]|uniref:DUF1559 family PulG-like putative transporter n=1 Tax=Gimesia sp. TaxID=2024833 RepID=UPI003A91531F
MRCLNLRGTLFVLLGFLCGGFAEVQEQSGQAVAQSKTGLAQVTLPRITPARFSGDQKELQLPGKIIDYVVASGGRYLILRLKNDRQLHVFDTVKAEIIQQLPMSADHFLLAAGAQSLLVVLPETRTIERWSLTSFKKETEAPLPFSAPVLEVSMGFASEGPLVLLTEDRKQFQLCQFIDPHTLKLLDLDRIIVKEKNDGSTGRRKITSGSAVQPHRFGSIRCSANGRIVAFDSGMILLTENSLEYQDLRMRGFGRPQPDAAGNLLYTYDECLSVYGDLAVQYYNPAIHIPAVQPGLYITLKPSLQDRFTPFQAALLQVERKSKIQIPLEKVDVTLSNSQGTCEVALTRRFSFIPDAQLLVQIPATADKLILHKVDHAALLKSVSENYAYVTSFPVTTAVPGKLYQYQLSVNSNHSVNYKLGRGPKDMTVSDSGLITWKVPAEISEVNVPVTILMSGPGENPRFKYSDYLFIITVPAATEKMNQEEINHALEINALELGHLITRYEDKAKKLQEELAANGTKAKQIVDENALLKLKQMEEKQKRTESEHESRTWKDSLGNELDAQFVESFGGKVKLKTRTEGEYDVSLNELSTGDQKYIRDLSAKAREEKQRIKAEEQLQISPRQEMRQIYAGMQNYLQQRQGSLLSAHSHNRYRQPLLSWRVNLLPYIGGDALYKLFHFDEPWDSEHNKRLIPLMPALYRTPNSKAGEGKTSLQVVIGENCLFKDWGGVGLELVTDDLDQTVMLVEVPDKLAVEWTKPDDWEFTSETAIKELFGSQSGGFYALFADGTVKLISRENSLKDISRAFIRDDGEAVKLK